MIIPDNYFDYFSSPHFKKNLRYGVIYVLKALNTSNDSTSFLKNLLHKFTGFSVQVIESHNTDGTTLVSRRFNVGNTGKESVVEMNLNEDSINDIIRFAESATNVFSEDEGDQVLTAEGNSMAGSSSSLDNQDYIDLSEKPESEEIFRLYNRFHNNAIESLSLPFSDYAQDEESDTACEIDSSPSHACRKRVRRAITARTPQEIDEEEQVMPAGIPDELEEEEREILTIEQKQQRALQAIQAQILEYVRIYQADPEKLMKTLLEGKVVIGPNNQLSPIVVNKDLKIVLPNYNEVEVKMPAMCRAIYIFFLKHPEGIALRDIDKHRADLENIYSIVMPGRSEERAKETIDNLLDPMSNTLNEYISKIKRCFKLCIINDELASHYCITGKRGEPYRINLDPELITLPRAVQ